MNITHKRWYSPISWGVLVPLVLALALTILVCSVNKWNLEPIRKLSRRSLDAEHQFAEFPSHSKLGYDSPQEQVIYLKPRPIHSSGNPHTHSHAHHHHHHHHHHQRNPPISTNESVYEWVAWGKPWVLRIWGDAKFLAPTFLVRKEGAHDSWVGPPHDHAHCFARGRIDGEKESDAALNICGGFRGVIRVGHLVYMIEPLGSESLSNKSNNNKSKKSKSDSRTDSENSNNNNSNNNNNNRNNRHSNRKHFSSNNNNNNNNNKNNKNNSDNKSNINNNNNNNDNKQSNNNNNSNNNKDNIDNNYNRNYFNNKSDTTTTTTTTTIHDNNNNSNNKYDDSNIDDIKNSESHSYLHYLFAWFLSASAKTNGDTSAHTQNPSSPHLLRLVSPQFLRGNREDLRETASAHFKDTGEQLPTEPFHEEDPHSLDLPDDGTGVNISVSKTTGSSYISREIDEYLVAVDEDYNRPKRFIFSRRHTIEVMVVVDHKMAHYHGELVDQYVLTLMSVVSLIFRDSSVGNNIDIAVVEVVKPEGKSFAPKKAYENYAAGRGKSAEEMLKMFCKWQKQGLKYNEDHPHRYDTALLITRENICRNPYTQRCDTLGLAELGTMCSRYASCAIVQDNGLSAAFTIAHELGHLLNMPHDNDDKCSQFRGSEKESQEHMNVMSRMLDHNTLPWIWSNCSRYYLSEYFQAGLGDCLEDEPWTNKIVEDDVEYTLAGELFSATKQCQYVFGKTSGICPYMPKCKRLWCTTTLDEKEGCRTQHMPWADGTPCDKDRWCLRGECTPKNREELRKIHGQWGAWQSWGVCSRSCGVGVRRSERFCDSPKPQYGGHFCVGERVRYESCKLRECPLGSIDFRSQQCKQFNGKNFGLPEIPEDVKWIPKYAESRRNDGCKLFCQAHNSGISYQLKEKVEDGTPCGPGTYDICVSGKCRVAGCDYVLNSTLKDDWCGICNGDNSTCQMTSGSLVDVQPWGYSDILVIPEGAARIEVLQKSYHDSPADDNYLALVDYETGEYLLNGNWVVTPFEKLVEFGGTLLEYTGSNEAIERINSTKPLKKKLLVQILSVGKLYPPNVHYSYSKSHQDSDPEYVWKMSEWTECSRPCVGHSEQTPFCIRADTEARVADFYCNETEKPLRRRKSCSLSCTVSWSYTDWGSCNLDASKSCIKQREVKACLTSEKTPVEVDRCADQTPVTEMDCEKEECPIWHYSGWTPCSCPSKAYRGRKKRLFACYMRKRPVNEWECGGLEKPYEEKTCPCWYAGEWGLCKVEESPTIMELRRRMEEVYSKPSMRGDDSDDFGRRSYKSPSIQKTSFDEFWDVSGGVVISCPRGKKRRKVICGPLFDSSPTHLCDLSHKPSEVSSCQVPCTTTTTTSTTTLRTTVPSTTIATTQMPPHSKRYRNSNKKKAPFNPDTNYDLEFPKRKSIGKTFWPKSKLKGGRRADFGVFGEKGGSIKGEKKEKTYIYDDKRTANEIANSLPTHHHHHDLNSNRVVIPPTSQRDDHHQKKVYDDRYGDKAYDSGEEEHNNLVKGHQDVDRYLWQTGRWTECSKECGGGERRRQVSCGGDRRLCPLHSRPAEREPCNMHPCTEWTHLKWERCQPSKRDPCRGRKHRAVLCRDQEGREVHPSLCLDEDRPTSEAPCRLSCDQKKKRPRNRYKWRKGPWTPCSETCGGGSAYRNVTCIDSLVGRVTVHNEYCLRFKRQPYTQKNCNKQPCPFQWVTGEWSQCSWRCGPGIQTREVTCHRVTPLGWVDPDPLEGGCRRRKAPPSRRECNMGFCTDSFFWVARPWKPCQGLCGSKGRQRRSVICVDSQGVRAQRNKCRRMLRPRRKQRCRAVPCGHRACVEVRTALDAYLDGEYSLLVGGVNMSVFCYGMNTTEPKEYLTLPAGEEGNYAEIYDKRLLRPDTCPYNGERRDNCHCVDDESGRAGLTTFSKIRLNTTSLAVNTFDFTFARPITGRLIAYGEAGDCYSMTQCPQGSFSINLAGTLLKVSERTTWKGHGNKAVHWINRLDESQRILGRCGGYCGTCTPDSFLGLKLDVRMTTDLSTRRYK